MNNKDRKAIAEAAKLLNITFTEYGLFLALCERLWQAGHLAGCEEMAALLAPKGVKAK